MHDRFTIIENQLVKLKNSTICLAGRLWIPDGADENPCPAILEFLPYRKRDGTCQRDEAAYAAFANAGIVGCRFDIAGSGESDGVMDGEYMEKELSQACELIAWIAKQKWCSGSVGMMGISWGGINSLQVAALQPPALKAIISCCSCVDRYNGDIHYKNGCHLSAQLSWAATILGYQTRPPDPVLVGNPWRKMWRERLEGELFFMEEWLRHQRRDNYWKRGSVCEEFPQINTPALMSGGWQDGYKNTPFEMVEGAGHITKAIVGSWCHLYPYYAMPLPRSDFLREAIAWWDRWLRGIDNGADKMPQVRAYILDAIRPAPQREYDQGFWVAKQEWKNPETRVFRVDSQFGVFLVEENDLVLGNRGKDEEWQYVKSPLDTGTAAGDFFALKPQAGEISKDQRIDDANSLNFDSLPLKEDQEYLGQPVVSLSLRCNAPTANICVRVGDMHPDGTVYRVSLGVLNLSHRNGNSNPEAMILDESTDITLKLDVCGYRFRKDHKIRLSISTSYWPMVLPTPTDPGLTINISSIVFSLPNLGEYEQVDVPQPQNPNPLPKYIELSPPASKRQIVQDLSLGKTISIVYSDTGMYEHPETGLATREVRDEEWSIVLDDPLSVKGKSTFTCELQRTRPQKWFVKTVATSDIYCTATEWIISATVVAYEGGEIFFEKSFGEKRIKRDFT